MADILLYRAPMPTKSTLMLEYNHSKLHDEQRKVQGLVEVISYLESKSLLSDPSQAKRLLNQPRKGYHVMDGVLYSEDQIYQTKGNLSSLVV